MALRRRILTAALGLSFLAVLCAPSDGSAEDARPAFSLLAVGDAGEPRTTSYPHEIRVAVARAMAAEARRRPVDAVAVLGDNFYPDGLIRERLVEQVRDNVVELLCPFVELADGAPAALSEMCPVASRSNPVPIFAVMGNHDLNDPGSAAMQQRELPKLVPNWIMAEDGARVFEVADGLSVVLVETEPFTAKGAEAKAIRAKLVPALRASKGPWRILVAHRPVAVGALGTGHIDNWYTRRFAKALAMAEVPVQLMLSGDQHNLQIIDGRPPAPRLNVIAGSGSDLREVGPVHERHLFAAMSPGFVRVDWIRDDAYPRLVVTAYTTYQREGPGFGVPVVAARWSVDRAGALREEQTGVTLAPLDTPPAAEPQDAAPAPGRPTEHRAAPGG